MTVLSFTINGNHYMFDIKHVNSIIEISADEIKPIPESPDFFLGITQHRNRAIGVLSAAVLFGQSQSFHTPFVSIVLIHEDEVYASVVDEVLGVRTIDDNAIQRNITSSMNQYANNVYVDGEIMYLLIDVPQLVDIRKLSSVKEA